MPDRHEGPVTDPSAWYGCDYANGTDWAHQLTNAELNDLDTALANVTEAGLAPLEFSRDAFQLPVLGPVLAGMLDELEDGCGFTLLRGLPVEKYDEPSLYRLYWGIAVHLGDMISQNAKGDLIGRVEDIGVDIRAPNARGYTTSAPLHPHKS